MKRFLEIIPGALVWSTFAAAILLSFFRPLWAIYFVIVFDLLWLFRVLYFVTFLLISWTRFRQTRKVDWFGKLAAEIPDWRAYHHLIFLPTYREPLPVIRDSLTSISASAYQLENIIIVLAGEERDREQFLSHARAVEAEFGQRFKRILVTVHPANLPDEIPGKGSNLHYAGGRAKELIDQLGLPYEKVIVSSLDIDTIVHPQYFAYLTYTYCRHPQPTRTSYQPVTLYSNNIWDAPAPVRIAAFGTTFWLMTELARPERLFTFSSHSMSFRMLTDVGFWEKDIVSEDSRIFLQGFFRYRGNYTVTPLSLPVSMDTVQGATYWRSLGALYRQQRRWAWGVEHFPYMARRFRQDPTIPLRLKIKYLWNHLEGMYTWATAPILIFFLGWLPLLVASFGGGSSLLVQNAPLTLEWLMRLAMIGVLASGIVSLTLLPPCPPHRHRLVWLVMLLQWALLPITFVIFGALPAIDAQTRLMFGRSLGFNVTAKQRKSG
ncbi:glycosyltransferase family 2 protein [Candidatus Uhrbacteria bacterium]|nr:glycosyltransferase family 2 protein [Candidatus Uhrbacteria bacterium]